MSITVRGEWHLACPNCTSDEHLQVQLVTMSDLPPDGTDPSGDHEWDDKSFMHCTSCGNAGKVRDFYVEEVQS